MLSKRVITFLAVAKIPYSTTYTHVRAIHVIPSISTYLQNIEVKSNVDRYRRTLLVNNLNSSTFETAKRYKSGRKNKKLTQDDESDEDDEEDVEELTGDKNAKVTTMQVISMRIDAIIKAGMGIARNKAEVALYDSKVRINGEKVIKKSLLVKVGDVIDVIRGPSPKNPNFLVVTRVIILSAVIHNEGFRIKFTRDKSLVIENYDDAWEPVQS